MTDRWHQFLIKENLTTNNIAIDKRLQLLTEAEVQCKCTDAAIVGTVTGSVSQQAANICKGKTRRYRPVIQGATKCPGGMIPVVGVAKKADPVKKAAALGKKVAKKAAVPGKKVAKKVAQPTAKQGPVLVFQRLYNKWAAANGQKGLPAYKTFPKGEDGDFGGATRGAMKLLKSLTTIKSFAGLAKIKEIEEKIPQYTAALMNAWTAGAQKQKVAAAAAAAKKSKAAAAAKKTGEEKAAAKKAKEEKTAAGVVAAKRKKELSGLKGDVALTIKRMDGWVDEKDMKLVHDMLAKYAKLKALKKFFDTYRAAEEGEDLRTDVEGISAIKSSIKVWKKRALNIIDKHVSAGLEPGKETKAEKGRGDSVLDLWKNKSAMIRVKQGKKTVKKAVQRFYKQSATRAMRDIQKILLNTRNIDPDDLDDHPVIRAYKFMLKKRGYKSRKDNEAKGAAMKLAGQIDDLMHGAKKVATERAKQQYLETAILDDLDVTREEADDAGFWDIFD
tara:strand:+ start:936 stop:2438 length:1503 start_codon:yes stop_codon:yes gene_type:complete